MAYMVLFLLALLRVASSTLPDQRLCDPEPRGDTPTFCSNYKNIIYLDAKQTELQDNQRMLEQKIAAMDGKTRLDIGELKTLVTNLTSALEDLGRMANQTEMRLRDAKTQLKSHEDDIADMKRDIQDLHAHRETVGGNLEEIEKKLGTTERQLREKKAKLESLETETEAAFNVTERLLNVYKNELSNLNTKAQELEGKFESKLEATKTTFGTKLDKIQENSEAFRAKLNEQKSQAAEFRDKTESRFTVVDEQLKTQKLTVDQQRTHIDALKRDTAEIKHRLGTTQEKLNEQNKLRNDVDRLTENVNAKVAFSATVIESPAVFTGPADTSNLLVFDKVFTNVGNAYNPKTGIFTAPRKGVYHFSFMTFGYNLYTSGAILVKNGHYQVSTWEFTGPDSTDTTSNTVILELNAGETVNIILWKGGKVHTSVFSGFLVFPS
uniref:protein CROWDED NUCLEI 2-like isoform X2 n=1 Tax=Scatophagus argus TaxID=75038 RepID=UPI001ED7F975|nr:protein CROWDED NUCLEI 2-like isoform X2 [Scatophagus argus]